MTRYADVRLGDVLELDVDTEDVEPAKTYEIAGVYGFGRGLFKRGAISGSETSYKRLTVLHADRFVLSRLKAFEGATAVVPKAFERSYVSSEFPTFRLDETSVLPDYLGFITRWPEFWDRLKAQSRGVGARRERVHPRQLYATTIPLPDLDEQRRVASHLDQALTRAAELRALAEINAPTKVTAAEPLLIETTVQRHTRATRPLGDIAEFVNDLVRPGDDPSPAKAFVGLQHIESHTGRRTGELPLGDEKGRKFRFQPGDVLYGYLRPYLNKVWFSDLHGLCSVEQYVLRSRGEVPPEFIAYALRSAAVLREANRLTHNLQLPRLRSGLLAEIEIPVIEGSYDDVLAELDSISEKVRSLADHSRQRMARVAAVEQSVLNYAFAGKL